ncbi:MAG TPA: aromatic ring-hydroxylating dioxygenase subunit alpha [Actinomycetota bacterium]|nr:aromatic ring-hydroxylating dioxygenase subunit alpha [Actinomycetota bacterium]
MDDVDLGPHPWTTLPGRDYHATDVFQLERDAVFARSWMCVGRSEDLDGEGAYAAIEVADEPILLVRGRDAAIRAFANTCRHRGTLLLEGTGTVRAVTCPYHAWTYALDGSLVGTPNVHADDGVDRAALGLHRTRVAEWGGFMFVNIDGTAPEFHHELERDPVASPLQLDRYRVDALRVGARLEYDVAANWKVVVENYHECLHCPTVHPELVRIVPLYKRGEVEEEGQHPLGNSMADGLTSFTRSGTSSLPTLPGLEDLDVHTFYGVYLFPNLILNYHSETVNAVTIWPLTAGRTRVVSEFLFRPETIAADVFDPSEVVDFRDLVARQDWVVCELVQRGVRSRFFAEGIYPRQERYIAEFNRRYLRTRDRRN